MNYAQYKEHEEESEREGDPQCNCSQCRLYRRAFSDQLEAERLGGEL